MKPRISKNKVQPRLEQLEDRWVPAVTSSFNGSTLTIGNGTASGGVPNTDAGIPTLRITFNSNGTVDAGQGTSTTNLANDVPAANVSIRLFNVASRTLVNGQAVGDTLAGSFSYYSGTGADSVSLGATTAAGVAGNVQISTGNGADSITVTDMTIGGSVTLNTSGGDDTATIDPTVIDGNLNVSGVQTFNLLDSDVGGNLSFDASRESLPGDVTLDVDSTIAGLANISLGSGDDDAHMNAAIGGDLIMNLGNGDNFMNNAGGDALNVGGNVIVTSGSGNDGILLDGLIGGSVTANTNAGNDTVAFGFNPSTVGGSQINLIMGDGDDVFLIVTNGLSAGGARLNFYGQNGDDSVDWSGAGAGTVVLGSAYLDGGFGINTFDPGVQTLSYPFTLINFS